jgi:hypothetical protein
LLVVVDDENFFGHTWLGSTLLTTLTFREVVDNTVSNTRSNQLIVQNRSTNYGKQTPIADSSSLCKGRAEQSPLARSDAANRGDSGMEPPFSLPE